MLHRYSRLKRLTRWTSSVSHAALLETAPTVYVNPICMQMDQMLLKCSSPEELLTALVTHRGALFVHNLVTSVDLLADMSSASIPFSRARKFRYPDEFEKCERDKLLEDPRYSLLLRDIMDSSAKLDLPSIDRIMSALYKMDHCQYRLIGCLLRRLYSIDIPAGSVSSALAIGSSLEWAGFGRAETFFKKLSFLVEADVSLLSKKEYMNSVLLFSKLPTLHEGVFGSLAREVPRRVPDFTSSEIGLLGIAVSEYGSTVSAAIVPAVQALADEMCGRPDATPRDLIRTSIALRRVNLHHTTLLEHAMAGVQKSISESLSLRERLDPSVSTFSDLGRLVESCAYFGRRDLCGIFFSEKFVRILEDHVDLVTEETAIRLLHALALAGVAGRKIYACNLLLRKIGSSSAWTKQKNKVISILFSQLLWFPPSVSANIPKFVADDCLGHYLRSRRGYGVPFPEEGRVLFEWYAKNNPEINNKAEFNAWIPNSPYNADILVPASRVAVLVLSQFDQANNPVGTDFMQCEHIRSLGWAVVAVNRNLIVENAIHELADTLTRQISP